VTSHSTTPTFFIFASFSMTPSIPPADLPAKTAVDCQSL
jgi:hypothetical protein